MGLREWREACWTFLFPAFCPGCSAEVEQRGEWCSVCRESMLDVRQLPLNQDSSLDELWAIGDYRGVLRDRILAYKFSPYRRELRFAFWSLLKSGQSKLPFLTDVSRVCPIPLYKSRKKERGFNQAEEIFCSWVKDRGLLWSDLLIRGQEAKAQSTLADKGQRRENVKGIFSFAGESRSLGTVLLVDDITTSGATLEEAARVLKKNGAERVIGLALASGALLADEIKILE